MIVYRLNKAAVKDVPKGTHRYAVAKANRNPEGRNLRSNRGGRKEKPAAPQKQDGPREGDSVDACKDGERRAAYEGESCREGSSRVTNVSGLLSPGWVPGLFYFSGLNPRTFMS